jgi:hypothetical protein
MPLVRLRGLPQMQQHDSQSRVKCKQGCERYACKKANWGDKM